METNTNGHTAPNEYPDGISFYEPKHFVRLTPFLIKSFDNKIHIIEDDKLSYISYITDEGDHLTIGENIPTTDIAALCDMINEIVPEYKEIFN